nr:ribonuclease P protein component [uncultured Gemmiger sp.]
MKYRVLNKNRDFTRIYSRGKSYVHPHMVLYVAKNRLGTTRIGLTATKKVGGAVQRNRARRVMRAALQEHLSQNVGGYDIILVARARTPHLKSTQVSRTFSRLLQKAGLPDKAPVAQATKEAPKPTPAAPKEGAGK